MKTFCKNLIGIFVTAVSLTGVVSAQTIITQGDVSGTWSASGSPYVITGEISIPSDSVLVIDPGVKVLFDGHYKFNVKGKLYAEGSPPNDIIVFAIQDTTGFADTTKPDGGWHGLRFIGNAQQDTSVITYCRISFGKAISDKPDDRNGGALYVGAYQKVIISNCVIMNNYSHKLGAGIYAGPNSTVLLNYNVISQNTSQAHGGGIYLNEVSYGRLDNNIIFSNIAVKKKNVPPYDNLSGCGGGVYVTDVDHNHVSLVNNFICNNLSVSGGGLYESCFGINVVGNIVCNNMGAGIYNGHQLGQGVFTNNTICNNSMGGGIHIFSNYVQLSNNIIRGNLGYLMEYLQIDTTWVNIPAVAFSNIEGGYPGNGNIDEDPLFLLPTPGPGLNYMAITSDWSLMDSSACINAGREDMTGYLLPAEDIYSRPRVHGGRIDIGASENQYALSVNEIQPTSPNWKAYPNPFISSFALQNDRQNNSISLFQLSDIQGNIIYDQEITNNSKITSLGNLPAGLYLCKIICPSYPPYVFKLLKQ